MVTFLSEMAVGESRERVSCSFAKVYHRRAPASWLALLRRYSQEAGVASESQVALLKE